MTEGRRTMHRLSSALLLVSLLLAGCAHNMADRGADASIVYGYMDMSDAPTGMTYLTLQQVKPRTKEPYWQTGVQKVDGGYVFYHYGLPPGTYQITEFGGQNCLLIFCGTPYAYSFPLQGHNASALVIGKPGVYFVGSFKYKRIRNGIFRADNFDVVAAQDHPPQTDLLQALAKDAPQNPAIQAQLQAAMGGTR